jgi:hypothetical protein
MSFPVTNLGPTLPAGSGRIRIYMKLFYRFGERKKALEVKLEHLAKA